jgi:SAM-dependent methyltransferase
MQLANPFPHRDLVRPYDWITYREPESHLDAVVERICSIPGIDAQARVAGITFKDKTTLERLRRRGFDRTWSLDAIDDFGATDANADIESIQALLTPERANEVVRKRGTVDLLIVRHIAEHTEDPRRFMAALATLLAPGGVMVIEIPDCSANLKRQDYSMIWEEHTLYLTPQTAPQLLASAGCAGVAIEVHPFAFEDVIVLYGRKSGAGATQAPLDRETVEPSIDLARRYAAAFEGWTQRYRQLFDGLTADGSRLAAYGAGHLTCAFLNFHGLADYFAFVVDDTPQKQGLFLPKARLPIVSRSRLTADSISACLFGLAPDIEDKVIANNHAYADAGGRFYSMFVDSPRSIRKLS